MSGFKQKIEKTQKNAEAMHNICRTISGNSIVSETGLEKDPREYSIWCLRYAKVTSIANIESFDVIVDNCDILSSYTYTVLRTHYSDIVSNLKCQENQTLLQRNKTDKSISFKVLSRIVSELQSPLKDKTKYGVTLILYCLT